MRKISLLFFGILHNTRHASLGEKFDQLQGTCATQCAEISQLKTEIMLLREKVQYLLKKRFGRSSEKLNSDQMELLLEELCDAQNALAACSDLELGS